MPPTWNRYLKHNKDSILPALESGEGIGDFTFESVAFQDGTLLKNVTFDELVDVVWAQQSKSASPSWAQPNES